MPSSLGPAEILVILVVALIVLGPKRLPEAGRQVGKAISEIRRWSQDVKYEMNQAFNPEVRVVRDPTPLAQPGTPPADGVETADTADTVETVDTVEAVEVVPPGPPVPVVDAPPEVGDPQPARAGDADGGPVAGDRAVPAAEERAAADEPQP